MTNTEFLTQAVAQARISGHIFHEYAACEAALESEWGNSRLATKCNNLFGEKEPHTNLLKDIAGNSYPIVSMPTHEYENGVLVPATADWPIFPDWKTCFFERMRLLKRLAPVFPHYAAALSATTGEEFVQEVSQTWSTDPHRATNVLNIFTEYNETLEAAIGATA